MSEKIGIIILARLSSSRLPGKILKRIKDKTILEYIVERIEQVIPKQDIILATSIEASDDKLASFASTIGIKVYRGSLDNVAARFIEAADYAGFDYAVRINGDNVFVDIPLLESMITLCAKRKPRFLSNVKGRTYPKGMSIEIVSVQYYNSLLRNINCDEHYKEHVTLYLYDNEQEGYIFFTNDEYPELKGLQMALDTQEDFDRTSVMINGFTKPHYKYNMKEINDIIKLK